ncbi:MAG: hypothetical protein ABIF77_10125 [bacterium]
MRKAHVLLVAVLLLVASSSFAQYPPSGATVGVYFDLDGTESVHYTFQPMTTIDFYVIIFWENLVGGTSYKIPMDPRLSVAGENFADGVAIGSAFDGCGVEFGFASPQFGYFVEPVLVCTVTILNTDPLPVETVLGVVPHCHYEQVIVSDRYSNLFSADGLCAAIPTENSSWGQVKQLYR